MNRGVQYVRRRVTVLFVRNISQDSRCTVCEHRRAQFAFPVPPLQMRLLFLWVMLPSKQTNCIYLVEDVVRRPWFMGSPVPSNAL